LETGPRFAVLLCLQLGSCHVPDARRAEQDHVLPGNLAALIRRASPAALRLATSRERTAARYSSCEQPASRPGLRGSGSRRRSAGCAARGRMPAYTFACIGCMMEQRTFRSVPVRQSVSSQSGRRSDSYQDMAACPATPRHVRPGRSAGRREDNRPHAAGVRRAVGETGSPGKYSARDPDRPPCRASGQISGPSQINSEGPDNGAYDDHLPHRISLNCRDSVDFQVG